MDGGGEAITGGVYTASATVGQPDTGTTMSKGNYWSGGPSYSVEGGFWSIIAVVQTSGSPPLAMRRTDPNTLTICWPYMATGFELQLSTNLNTVNWAAATNMPVQVSNEWQITVTPPTEGSLDEAYCQYYRLKKP